MSKAEGEVWQCRIGPVAPGMLPRGADKPMRDAVEQALFAMCPSIDRSSVWVFSGWGERFDELEAATIEGRDTDFDKVADSIAQELVAKGLSVAVCAALIGRIAGDGAVTARAYLHEILRAGGVVMDGSAS